MEKVDKPSRKPTSCSRCKQEGHTMRTCKTVIEGVDIPAHQKACRVSKRSIDVVDQAVGDSDEESLVSNGAESIQDIDEFDANDDCEAPFQWDKWMTNDITCSEPEPAQSLEFTKTLDELGPNLVSLKYGGVVKGASVLSYFMLFWSPAVIEEFLVAINAFGPTHFKSLWKDVSPGEFKAFLAVCLALGFVKYPDRDTAFNDSEFGCTFIKRLMTLRRFEQILRAWHWKDMSKVTQEQRAEFKEANPFWAVDEFCSKMSGVCQSLYTCSQYVDVDEQCIPWKGRHKCRCYNPNKPEKFHFKIFSLNDSKSRYQWNFYLYRGASEIRPDGISATMYPVTKLFNEKLWHSKHILFLDNWYTGLPLLTWIIRTGSELIGTVKVNKEGLPAAGKMSKTGPNKKKRGECQQSVHDIPGEVIPKAYFTAWMDKKPVHILSTFGGGVGNCIRKVQDKTNQTWSKVTYSQPSLIKTYNAGMGGTDGFDQWLAMFRAKIKTTTWLPKVFLHILNITFVNSYIIYKDVESLGKKFTLSKYIQNLMHELANDYFAELKDAEDSQLTVHEEDENPQRKWSRLKTLQKSHFRLVGALHRPFKESLVLQNKSKEKMRKKNQDISGKITLIIKGSDALYAVSKNLMSNALHVEYFFVLKEILALLVGTNFILAKLSEIFFLSLIFNHTNQVRKIVPDLAQIEGLNRQE